jgi:hypothetical protein
MTESLISHRRRLAAAAGAALALMSISAARDHVLIGTGSAQARPCARCYEEPPPPRNLIAKKTDPTGV